MAAGYELLLRINPDYCDPGRPLGSLSVAAPLGYPWSAAEANDGIFAVVVVADLDDPSPWLAPRYASAVTDPDNPPPIALGRDKCLDLVALAAKVGGPIAGARIAVTAAELTAMTVDAS